MQYIFRLSRHFLFCVLGIYGIILISGCEAFKEDKARQSQIAQEIWQEDSLRVETWLSALTIPVDTVTDSLLRDSLLRHTTTFIPPTFTQYRTQPSPEQDSMAPDSLSLRQDSSLDVP